MIPHKDVWTIKMSTKQSRIIYNWGLWSGSDSSRIVQQTNRSATKLAGFGLSTPNGQCEVGLLNAVIISDI